MRTDQVLGIDRTMQRTGLTIVLLTALALGTLLLARGDGGDGEIDSPGRTPGRITTYLPEESSPGFNLFLQKRRVPTIRDMNGHVVHSWPGVRATGRVRLGGDCNLTVIGADNRIKQFDWDGDLLRTYSLADEGDLPHHDLVQLENGNFLLLARDLTTKDEYLLEVDSDDRGVWEWRAQDHSSSFAGWDHDDRNPVHINSVHEIPPNRWYREGDERFRPGNILVSARNLNTIFVINKVDGSVVWKYSEGLDRQHEASMLADGQHHEGMILVFNNGLENLYDYRETKVQIIDPTQGGLLWQYSSDFFFSSEGGIVQQLAGGNLLITSSRGGRIFEITTEGKIVWEWVPSFNPMRPERLAYDHCPQLAAIEPSAPLRIDPRHDRPFIDRELYDFAWRQETKKKRLYGEDRRLLRVSNRCRELLIPANAALRIEYGFDRKLLRKGTYPLTSHFVITLARIDPEGNSGAPASLLDATLVSDTDELWHRQVIELAEHAYQSVDLCLSIDSAGREKFPERVALWGEPAISWRTVAGAEQDDENGLSEPEQELRRQQLRALGYVN